ncbi:MAG: hypothetical protein A3G87_07540 [Omnitrophica bacterium RIFCSPLOWO2_12_FULL_50_11]|nr:MAG: hypothetical protein A3G87_07540 [Omnitrophica bacterium RIFCSPLOWO2_12_FULL_50_11]
MLAVNSHEIRNILVVTLSNIGDVILTTPVFSLLRDYFPSARVSVIVGPKGVPVFTHSQTVDRVIEFDKRMSWLEKLKFIRGLRKERFDLIVDLRNTLIPFLLRARYRTPLARKQSGLAMRERHLNRLKPLLVVKNQKNGFHFFTDEEQQSGLRKLKREIPTASDNEFILVAPGAGSHLKRWTISGFRDLVHHFFDLGRSVVLVGDEKERELGLELGRVRAGPLANLIGELTIREAAGLVARAALVVANDSAVMHLGHELERPTVSIFGPTSEQKYGRAGDRYRTVRLNLECTPCEQPECRLAYRACLDDLPASSIIETCGELLRNASS